MVTLVGRCRRAVTGSKGVPLSYTLHFLFDRFGGQRIFVFIIYCRRTHIFGQIQRCVHLIVEFHTTLFAQHGIRIIHLRPDCTNATHQLVILCIRDLAVFMVAHQIRQLDKIRLLFVYVLIQVTIKFISLRTIQTVCWFRECINIL